MSHRFTTLALAGTLLIGAAACADSSDDLERGLLVEEATAPREVLDPDEKAALADVISDFADIATVVPDLFDYEPDTDTDKAGNFELTCAGGLEPTVIFVGRSSTTWPDVDMAEASADLFGARVCTYDAPGTTDAIDPGGDRRGGDGRHGRDPCQRQSDGRRPFRRARGSGVVRAGTCGRRRRRHDARCRCRLDRA